MDYQEVIYEVSDKVATVTLNRPDKLNAWTGRMDAEYRHALAQAEGDDSVRVIIVTGAGRGFCAGADMGGLLKTSQGDASGFQDDLPTSEPGNDRGDTENFKKHYSFAPAISKPIIGAINGACAGLGLVHTLYFDIRWASDKAKFTTAFAARGLIAEHGCSWLLPKLIGMNNAMDLLLSARVIGAQEAYEMGLVGKVIPAEDFMEEVREYATHMATFSSPQSTSIMKRQMWDALFSDLGEAIEIANVEMAKTLTSDDFKEGVQSFMEKRAPEFVGH